MTAELKQLKSEFPDEGAAGRVLFIKQQQPPANAFSVAVQFPHMSDAIKVVSLRYISEATTRLRFNPYVNEHPRSFLISIIPRLLTPNRGDSTNPEAVHHQDLKQV